MYHISSSIAAITVIKDSHQTDDSTEISCAEGPYAMACRDNER